MKNKSILFVIFCLVQMNSFAQINIDSLIIKNSTYYSEGDSVPYSGKVVKYYKNSKQQSLRGELLDGKKDSKWVYWNKDGSKIGYDNFLRSWKHGKTIRYKDGYIEIEEYYDNGKRHGKFIARSARDKLIYNRFYHYGKKVGLWTTWYTNGVKQDEGNYINNKKEGEWKGWYENKQLKYLVYYKDDKLYGKCVGWTKDGKINTMNLYAGGNESRKMWASESGESLTQQLGHDYSGIVVVPFWETLSNRDLDKHKINEEWTFVNGQPDGLMLDFDKEGNLRKEINYKAGKKHGTSTLYLPNGTIASELNYKNGLLSGLSKKWFKSGQLNYKENYVNDIIDGKKIHYHADGSTKRIQHFKMGLEYGKSTEWYNNGNILYKITYKDGKRNGKGLFYYENGQLKGESEFLNDFNDGKCTLYHKNGQIWMEGEFKYAQRIGKWNIWNQKGKLLAQFIYSNGIPIEIKDGFVLKNKVTQSQLTFEGDFT